MNTIEMDDYLLVDTPGLSDTGGMQIDIANAIALQNAFSKASSIKIVCMIFEKSIF